MRVKLTGDTRGAVKLLTRIVHELEDPGPVFNEIADALRDASQRQYDTGAGWRKLKPETIKRKGSKQVLVMSGNLEESFTKAGSRYSELKITKDSVSISTSLKYAYFQGKGRNPSKVKKRQTEEEIAEIFDRYLQRGRG